MHGCTQIRDRRTASQPLTGIRAAPGTNSDLHPKCDFQSYTHVYDLRSLKKKSVVSTAVTILQKTWKIQNCHWHDQDARLTLYQERWDSERQALARGTTPKTTSWLQTWRLHQNQSNMIMATHPAAERCVSARTALGFLPVRLIRNACIVCSNTWSL